MSKVIPARMELGAYQMYKFMSANLTFAILMGLGALFVSWNDCKREIYPAAPRSVVSGQPA